MEKPPARAALLCAGGKIEAKQETNRKTFVMDIIHNGENLMERWFKDRSVIDVEITVGHVWMTFTGLVRYFNNVELVLSHAEGGIVYFPLRPQWQRV